MVNYDVIRNATATAIKALGIQESKGLTALNGPRTKVIGDALVNKLTVYGGGKTPSDEFLTKVFLKAAPVLAQPWSSNIEMVDMAIDEGKQLQYDYNKYGLDKQLHKSSFQRVTPYQLILHKHHPYN